MRDWDTYDYDIFVCFNNVDYITYEGLRLTKILVLDIKIPGLHYLWGIETVITWYKSSYIIRSMDYITYEGLRLYTSLKVITIDLRITLPMRDWDPFSLSCYIPPWKDYITYEGLRLFFFAILLSSLLYGLHYLWGIETN